MEALQKFDIKIFAESGADIDPLEFVAVLQRWIREGTAEGIPIDVVDYSHMHHGPGVILVGHYVNIGIDYTGGRMGLLYHQKQSAEGDFSQRFRTNLKNALEACIQLEAGEGFKGRLKFGSGEFMVIANDRLQTDGQEDAATMLRDGISEVARELFGPKVAFTLEDGDPRARPSVSIKVPESIDLASIIQRCSESVEA